jgi:hypothetical protein
MLRRGEKNKGQGSKKARWGEKQRKSRAKKV